MFEFGRLNRTYQMDDSQVAPVRQGPVTIHLSSPRNSLILKGHSVSLRPLGNGLYQASVGLDLLGSGDLTADLVTDAGTSSRLEDLVVVPRQTVRVDGRVSFQRVAGGWDVTALYPAAGGRARHPEPARRQPGHPVRARWRSSSASTATGSTGRSPAWRCRCRRRARVFSCRRRS